MAFLLLAVAKFLVFLLHHPVCAGRSNISSLRHIQSGAKDVRVTIYKRHCGWLMKTKSSIVQEAELSMRPYDTQQ